MDFRLDKVDPELRQRIKETVSSRRVHTKSGLIINKDNKDKKKGGSQDFSQELEKHKNNQKNKDKKIISVEAVKTNELKVSAYKDETDELVKDNFRGHILDVKK